MINRKDFGYRNVFNRKVRQARNEILVAPNFPTSVDFTEKDLRKIRDGGLESIAATKAWAKELLFENLKKCIRDNIVEWFEEEFERSWSQFAISAQLQPYVSQSEAVKAIASHIEVSIDAAIQTKIRIAIAGPDVKATRKWIEVLAQCLPQAKYRMLPMEITTASGAFLKGIPGNKEQFWRDGRWTMVVFFEYNDECERAWNWAKTGLRLVENPIGLRTL